MKKSLLLIAGMLVPLFPTGSVAQTETKATQQCFYNGENFNQNASISIGGKLYKCIKGGLWNNNNGPNAKANCFYDGRIYSKQQGKRPTRKSKRFLIIHHIINMY